MNIADKSKLYVEIAVVSDRERLHRSRIAGLFLAAISLIMGGYASAM